MHRFQPLHRSRCAPGLLLAVLAALAGAFPQTARADDRDLLKESFGSPYVFILFDTSGSMHWSTRCTAEQIAAGECSSLCTDRDCPVPLNGDDPNSKLYQAKEALFEVLSTVNNVNFGFATYNQDDLRLRAKHWLYAAETVGVAIPGWGPFPAVGETDVFGYQWNCDTGGGDNNIGCYPNGGNPADLADAWELTRVHRLPKGGIDFNQDRRFYVRQGGEVYWVEYEPASGTLGDAQVDVQVTVERCQQTNNTNSCNDSDERDPVGSVTVTFRRISDFNSWDFQAGRTSPQGGFFSQAEASDSPASNTCGGWDPNDDTGADTYAGYDVRFPTTQHPNPSFRPFLNEGDVLPLSWEEDHREDILRRLAPNRVLGETTPDFRTARYFADTPQGGVLRLRDEDVRPLVAYGSTPLGFSLAAFRTWYAGCEQGSCQGDTGWSDLAAANDPDWACRKKYLLVITDGDDTCPGRDPCSFTAALFAQEAVKTFVVGFGVQNTPGNRLTCMASNGGTGEPIYPENKQQLIDALTRIFGSIQEEARSFASAAVPTVQADVADKIYLSSFTPLNDSSVWDGHLDAFLKPLPVTTDGRPDKSVTCDSLPPDKRSGCFLWDAGASMLTQAPTQGEVDSGVLRLGDAENERRVYYPLAANLLTGAVPNGRRLLTQAGNVAERQDLWDGLGLNYTALDLTTPGSPPDLEAETIIEETLVQKTATLEDPDGNMFGITFVLGDIFHSNPVVIENPNNFRFYAGDLYGDGSECVDGNPGYRCFADKHLRRRKMIAVGSNDGMVHFFDSGVFDTATDTFGNGFGKELFAVIPRLTLPVVEELAEGSSQIFAVDGTLRVVDVFIDPAHSTADPPSDNQREWRTIGVGGLREGGIKDGGSRVTLDNGKPFTSGYYALDLTQPDKLDADNEPINQNLVPTCLTDYTAAACGPVDFGAELWEFTDSIDGSPAEWGIALDEDENGYPDLGDTWSTPVIARIKILDGAGGTEDRFVAAFGGGFDPENRGNPQRGNWLYMVDVETGQTLYKQPLDGAAPAPPAGVDENQDGYLDVLYIGTTAGYMYKVDLSVPVGVEDVDVTDLAGNTHSVERVVDEAWEPFKIFDTVDSSGERGPIFFAPTVLFVAQINRRALAFGTGDRESLWEFDGREGRFYVIVDDGFTAADVAAGSLPNTEADYQVFDSESPAVAGDEDFVLRPGPGLERGWVLTLDPDERVVAQAFSVAGVTIFPTFQPEVFTFGSAGEEACARTGDSRIFVAFSNNANPILPPDPLTGVSGRSMTVGEALVTPPYAQQRSTKNPGDGPPPDPDKLAWEQAIRETLEQLFPPGTRFANYTIDISFIRSDTGVVGPIPVPIGILEQNWKEY